jgi:SAM-dependent methyltransferase
VEPDTNDSCLDVGTGAGNVALALAPFVKWVVALDLTQSMVDLVRDRAQELGNVEPVLAAAEKMPFDNDQFDIVMCRLCAHHFADIELAIDEMCRVLRPNGRLLINDTIASESASVDDELNEIEKLRDPSHVRNYRVSEWQSMVLSRGLSVSHVEINHYTENGEPMEFHSWTRRIGTPEANLGTLYDRMVNASEVLMQELEMQCVDGTVTFKLPQLTLLAKKPALA